MKKTTAIIASLLLCCLYVLLELGICKARYGLALSIVALGTVIFFTRPWQVFERVGFRNIVIVAAISYAFALAGPGEFLFQNLSYLSLASSWSLAFRWAELTILWSLFFLVSSITNYTSPAPRKSWAGFTRIGLCAVFVTIFLVLATFFVWMPGIYLPDIDEIHYLEQAEQLANGRLGKPMPETLKDFFIHRQAFYRNGVLYGQYPPGWPAILAVFSFANAHTYVPVLVGTAILLLTYLIGSALVSPSVGFSACLLLGTCQLFFQYANSFYSHSATALFLLLGFYLLLKSPRLHFLAGLAVAVSIVTRPVTGVVIGCCILGWKLAHTDNWNARIKTAIYFALGCAPALPLLLVYNQATTGNALSFGYAEANPGLHDFGFGTRGLILYDGLGNAVADTFSFDLPLAVSSLVLRIQEALYQLLYPGFAFLLLALLAAHRLPVNRLALLLPGLVVLVYFFFPFSYLRFYFELLPFLMIGVAAWLYELASNRRRLAQIAVVAVIASNTFYSTIFFYNVDQSNEKELRPYQGVVCSDKEKPTLVFVKDPGGVSNTLETLVSLNEPLSGSNCIIVRDLGERNALLRSQYPGSEEQFIGITQ